VVFSDARLRAYGPYLPWPPLSELASERRFGSDRTVGKVTRSQFGVTRGRGSIPGKFKGLLSSPKGLDQLWRPSILLFIGERIRFHRE
jgi:hypothetical protein